MKTIVIEHLPTPETLPAWYFVADSSLVNSGKPFYIPEFADEFEAFMAPVVRIKRLGKTIGRKFASRYYSEIAPGIHIRAPKLRQELLKAGLPADPAHNFDRAMTVGEFLPLESLPEDARLRFFKNGSPVAEWSVTSTAAEVDEVIERVSRTNILKMGDFIIPRICGPTDIKIGDRLSVTLNDEELLLLNIR